MIRRIISLFLTGMLVSVLAVECVLLEVDVDIDYQDKSRESSVPVYDARM